MVRSMKNTKKFMIMGLVLLLLLSGTVTFSQAIGTPRPTNEISEIQPAVGIIDQPETPSDEPVLDGPTTVTGTYLNIETPLYVYSGQSFTVVVTAEGKPIQNALVTIKGETQKEYTSSNGSVVLTAPLTNETKNVSIIASKEGYITDTQMITVYGWYLRTDSLKQLSLSAPHTVKEGEKFVVRVTYKNVSVENALITVSWEAKPVYTDRNGEAELIAPETKNGSSENITASKTGYNSASVTIVVEEDQVLTTLAGDVNQDGSIDITDAVYLLNYIFNSGPAPEDMHSADVNGDGFVCISDVVYLLAYVFGTGPTPVSY
jgi:hypothetical protein